MTKQLERDIKTIRGHLAVGNKEAAQRIVDFMLRAAATDAAKKKIVAALATI